jgi:hypothetical protein
MEEDLEYFEESSTEDDNAHASQELLEARAQSPLRNLSTEPNENSSHIEGNSDPTKSQWQMMEGVESSVFIRTPTITTLSHETANVDIETSIDPSQAISSPRSENPMSVACLPSPDPFSISMQDFSFSKALLSASSKQQKSNNFGSDPDVNEKLISTTQRHHLLKVFLDHTSSWVGQKVSSENLYSHLPDRFETFDKFFRS